MTFRSAPRSRLLALYFALTFLIGWGAWLAAFYFPRLPRLFPLIGLFAPAISALVVAGLAGGRSAVAGVLGRYARWRFPLGWYVISILLIPLLFLLAILVDRVAFRSSTQDVWVGSPFYFVIAAFLWLMFITSGEEIGWRGFALPTLLADFRSPAWVSLFLGIVWGLWHLPLYLFPGQSSFPFPLFLVLTIGLSLIYTAVFLKTGGSLVSAVLLHASTDLAPRIVQIAKFPRRIWLTLDFLVWVAAAVLMILQRRGREPVRLPN